MELVEKRERSANRKSCTYCEELSQRSCQCRITVLRCANPAVPKDWVAFAPLSK